jgi:hypothetical protein
MIDTIDNDNLIFETKLGSIERVLGIIQVLFGFGITLFLLLSLLKKYSGGNLFLAIFCLVFTIQVIRTSKTFHLYSNRLIIRRPLFFSRKTDIVVNLNEIKEIIFRRIRGRYGGPHIIIKAKRFNESYRIDFSNRILNEFIAKLIEREVKTSKENM